MTLPGWQGAVDGRAGALHAMDAWLKQCPEDFVVEERPAYACDGSGTHLWLWVQKRGTTTRAVAAELAALFGKPPRAVGYAGQKDARAVTWQWFSVEHPPADFEVRLGERLRARALGEGACSLDDATRWCVRDFTWHRTRLGLGHTHGNRFRLRLRGLSAAQAKLAEERFATLVREGAPNAFGAQRFGARGTNAAAGAALLAGDAGAFLGLVLGRVADQDRGPIRTARLAFDAGDLAAAREAWPKRERFERGLLASLLAGASPERAVERAPRRELAFFLHAWQSAGFNRVLALRAAAGLALEAGDLALRLPAARAAFAIEDLAHERARQARLEITPSGPLFGARMPWPTGAVGELERGVLAESGVDATALGGWKKALPGERRGLVMRVDEPAFSREDTPDGPLVTLEFALAKGCFATALVSALRLDEGA